MIKRLQITLLALFVGVWAMALETSVKNADGVEIWYDFDSNAKTASVTYKGESQYSYDDEYIGNVVIPSKVTYEGEEYSVTSIESFAFQGCSSLTSITIPEGVTEIGFMVFYNCSSLTSITLPEGVTSIGENAFEYCSSLTSIDVALDNNSYTSIDGVLFSKDKTILIKYPEGKKDATPYIIPESVTKIGNSAFNECISLTSVTIPKGVTSIGDYAFYGCGSLTTITLPESVTEIGSSAFYDCSSLTSITIPEGVTEIGNSAFYDCSSLTNVTIPKNVTEIGSSAFEGCYKLYEVYNRSNLAIIAGSWGNGFVAYYAKNVYTDDSGESKLHTVGDYIFYVDEDNIELLAYLGDETAITLPSDYEGKNYKIGDYAFNGCSSLTSITLPESVTEIGNGAFYNCSFLTNVTIPESVTMIGVYAFYGCGSLTSITIPESVTEIGEDAFNYCYRLYEVYNKSNLTITAGSSENGYVAYYAKNVYTNESEESKLKTVGDYIFYVDEDNIELLVYLGDETAIILPSDYEGKNYKIGNYAFSSCSSLTSITIPESVTEIGDYAFYYCDYLTSITLPESVTEIGSGAFHYCSSLTSITIPESVTEIGEWAFSCCSSLKNITSMNVTPTSIYYDSFFEVDKSIPVYVLKQSVEAYKSAEYWKDFTNIVGKFLVVTATAENGTVTGAGVYEENEEVTLIATPDEGYTFVKWEDGETNATRKITVTEDVELSAVFELNSSVTPISDVVADSVSIRLIGNSLIIEGAESYAVYALSGQCLGKVESLERGVYIVVADGVSKKIVVK